MTTSFEPNISFCSILTILCFSQGVLKQIIFTIHDLNRLYASKGARLALSSFICLCCGNRAQSGASQVWMMSPFAVVARFGPPVALSHWLARQKLPGVSTKLVRRQSEGVSGDLVTEQNH